MSEVEETEGIKARTVLWYLTFSGFAINFMLRININIAIVDMISDEFKVKEIVISECTQIKENEMIPTLHNSSSSGERRYVSVEKRFLDFIAVEHQVNGFDWDSKTQNEVLGAFFLLHWATQLPGGMLAARFGTKLVFGLSNFLTCFTCFLIPITTYLNFNAMILLRIFQGFVLGASYPAMNSLVGHWIPPNERSKFVTAYIGTSIGVAITYPIFGFIIQISSWENVFHFCGVIGTIWYCLWLYFVYDLPENHPRIDPREKHFILKSLESSRSNGSEQLKVPWKAMLMSKATWMNVLAQWGSFWGLLTVLAQAPSYFRLHGWGVEMTGILSGFPHLLRVIFSLIMSMICDHLLAKNKMSRTNVRKLATFFSLILSGFFVLALAFCGCHVILAIAFLSVSVMLNGAVTSGGLASIVDISPNFASISLGIVSTVAVLTGFISPWIVGNLTEGRQHSLEPWKYIFEICAAMQIVCGILYLLFSDSSLQDWNNPQFALKSEGMKFQKNFKEEKAKAFECDKI